MKDFSATTIIADIDDNTKHEWKTSKDGYKFDLRGERWQLNNKVTFSISELRRVLPGKLLNSCIRTLANDAANYSAVTMTTTFSSLMDFFRFIANRDCEDEITLAMVVNYRDYRLRIDGHEKLMSTGVRPFLKRWNSLGYDGVSNETIRHMYRWRLKSPETGVAVNREDVNEGPLMPDEHAALEAQWLTAFENGDLTLDKYVSLRLLSVTGRRPIQIVHLKLKDLDDSRMDDGRGKSNPAPIYLLHIPRAKGKGHSFRSRFRAVPLSNGLWTLLLAQRQDVIDRFDRIFSECQITLQPNDLATIRGEMPLLPFWHAIEPYALGLRESIQAGQHGVALNSLREIIKGEAWHRRSGFIDELLGQMEKLIKAKNREGSPLHVFARRFRYTLEFRLENQGCAPAVIAWNLDHSSTKHLVSYSKNGPDKARRLSKAMALKLQPYIKMFQGQLVDSETNVPDADPAASRIQIDGNVNGATCAKNRACGLTSIPRCCYNGCPHFRPWVDGPHEQYLISLLEERERDLKTLRPLEDRAIIEAADNLILGVVQVIRLCEERKVQFTKKRPAKSRSPRKATQ